MRDPAKVHGERELGEGVIGTRIRDGGIGIISRVSTALQANHKHGHSTPVWMTQSAITKQDTRDRRPKRRNSLRNVTERYLLL